MTPGVLLEPYMSQGGGGQGVAETPIVLKGLNTMRKAFFPKSFSIIDRSFNFSFC